MEPLLLESDIPANTSEAQLETLIVDNGVHAKADGNIKTESEVESPSSNIGDAIKALLPSTILKSKGKKGKRKVKDQMKAVVPVQSQRLLRSATGNHHKESTPVIDVDSSTLAPTAKDVSATLFTCDADLPAESKLELLLSAPYCDNKYDKERLVAMSLFLLLLFLVESDFF
jgi:hypothetical protein